MFDNAGVSRIAGYVLLCRAGGSVVRNRLVRRLASCLLLSAFLIAGAQALAPLAAAGSAAGWQAFGTGDYVRADAEWRPLAEAGDRAAQFAMGVLADTLEHDAEALDWYRLAAEAGQTDAQVILGARFAMGMGVETDLVQAYYWLDRAAKRDHPNAAAFRDSLWPRLTKDQRAIIKIITE